MNNGLAIHKEFLKELEAEAEASRKCLERIPEKIYDWKPHERSMAMHSLTYVVADIPRWIQQIVETPSIDFANYNNTQPKTTTEMEWVCSRIIGWEPNLIASSGDALLRKTENSL